MMNLFIFDDKKIPKHIHHGSQNFKTVDVYYHCHVQYF